MAKDTKVTFLYSLFDKKTNEYGPVLEFGSGAAAVRAVQNLIKVRPESPIALNPEDFLLCYLGSFDQVTGKLIPELETLDFLIGTRSENDEVQ